jgi:hypothetical protein
MNKSRKQWNLATLFVALGAPAVLGMSACAGGNSEDPIQSQRSELSAVPDPQAAAVAKNARAAEVTAWISAQHRSLGRRVVRTDTTDDGTIVDWVDAKTVPGSNAKSPAPLGGAQNAMAEQALPKKLSGPPGALPFIRPTFLSYVQGDIAANNLDDYLKKIAHDRALRGGPGGNPNSQNNRLYAPDALSQTNFGLEGFTNNFWTNIVSPSSPDFSFYEFADYCRNAGGSVTDLVGIIEGIDPQVYGSATVFGAEYFQNGSQAWVTGGGNQGPWHQFSTSYAPGISISGPSTIGGASTEIQMAVILFNASSGATPGWWVWLGNQWVGFFDSNAFTFIKNSGCLGQWYGEVFDPDQATTHWTSATMGSGRLPNGSAFSNNFGSVGYLRQPIFYTAINNSGGTFMTSLNLTGGMDTHCYNVTLSTDGNSSYNPTLFFGGPGGGGTGCN